MEKDELTDIKQLYTGMSESRFGLTPHSHGHVNTHTNIGCCSIERQ